MNWENLQTNSCPYAYCGGELVLVEDEALVCCMQCKFYIPESKFNSIKAHRSQSGTPAVRLKWQNLHEKRCPICGALLRKAIGMHHMLECGDVKKCSFRIGEKRAQEIMDDPTHSANIFRAKLDEVIDKELENLDIF